MEGGGWRVIQVRNIGTENEEGPLFSSKERKRREPTRDRGNVENISFLIGG